MEAPSFMRRPSAPVLAIRSEPGTKGAFAGSLTSRVDANLDLHQRLEEEAGDNQVQGLQFRQLKSDCRLLTQGCAGAQRGDGN